MRRKAYPDPKQHLEKHMRRSAAKYINGLERAGLQPNETLTRAMAERAMNEAKEDYIREASEIRDSNIEAIMKDHHRRMNAIKREGASLRLKTCPPIALLFGGLAWYTFSHSGDGIVAAIYASMSVAFLLMLVLGAVFDRPRG